MADAIVCKDQKHCYRCNVPVDRTPSKTRKGEISDKVFCSRECYDLARIERRGFCASCGQRLPFSGKRKYCSYGCNKKEKKAKPKNCLNCGCLFTPVKFHAGAGRMISYNAGKTCSRACYIERIKTDEVRKAKISAAFSGENHPGWQGGKSWFGYLRSRGPNWKKQRLKAIERDGYKCQHCGISNDECKEKYKRRLDVDHITPYHQFTSYKKANKISNLITLCASCHKKYESSKTEQQMVLPIMEHGPNHKGYVCGERVNTARLKTEQVLQIRKRADNGESFTKIGKDYNVGCGHISDIVRWKIWKHLPLGKLTHDKKFVYKRNLQKDEK